jgi:hypothetical protein
MIVLTVCYGPSFIINFAQIITFYKKKLARSLNSAGEGLSKSIFMYEIREGGRFMKNIKLSVDFSWPNFQTFSIVGSFHIKQFI